MSKALAALTCVALAPSTARAQQLNCLEPLAFPLFLNVSTCEPGWHCPNFVADDPFTWPQVCPPTIECALQRLGSAWCEPQGLFEPQLCLPGYFCANESAVEPCPAGTHCWRGSSSPAACPALSSCPPLTETPRYFGGVVAALVADAVLLGLYVTGRLLERARLRRHNARHLVTFRRAASEGGSSWGSPSSSPRASPLSAPAGGPPALRLLAWSATKGGAAAQADAVAPLLLAPHPSDLGDADGGEGAPPPQSPVGGGVADFGQSRAVLAEGFSACNAGVRLHLSFSALSYTLPASAGSKCILRSVSGHIRPSRVTAVMGPSGAGKTTFARVLLGLLPRSSGELLINGLPDSLQAHKKAVGVVPQGDVMLPELTVRESVHFSARMRLPWTGWSNARVRRHVDAVLGVLGLAECAHVETSRVSGGQRKRCNIGLELAMCPAAVVLDEPTSGLDSSAALEVALTLRAIADLGLTVVAVVHQPRAEIFQALDDLLLLAPGGVTAFMGPRELVVPYFESLGFAFGVNNPADELLDYVAGRAGSRGPTAASLPPGVPVPDSASAATAFFEAMWRKRGRHFVETHAGVETPVAPPPAAAEAGAALERVSSHRGAPLAVQLLLFFARSLLQQYRGASTLALELSVTLMAGAVMGAAASRLPVLYNGILRPPYTLISPAPLEMMVPSIGLFVSLAIGLAGSPAGVLTFGEERENAHREAAAGLSPIAYFLAKSLAVVPRILLGSLHMCGVFCVLATPVASFWGEWLPIVVAMMWSVYGLASIVSMVSPRHQAALLAVIVSLFVGSLAGYGPSLVQANGWRALWLWDLSYARWASEAIFDVETAPFRGRFLVEVSASLWGYELDRFSSNIVTCILLGLGYRLVALLLMLRSLRAPPV